MTTKEIVQILSERVGREFDLPFQEELRVIVNGWRSRIMRQTLTNNPNDRIFFQEPFTVDLEDADPSLCAQLNLCAVKRSKKKIPRPVRANNILFDFVGTPEFSVAFSRVQNWQLAFFNETKWVAGTTVYDYIGGYLYIYNNTEINTVGIRGVIEDTRALLDIRACEGDCLEEELDFLVPDEIGQAIIQSVLATELRNVIRPDTTEIKPNEPTE